MVLLAACDPNAVLAVASAGAIGQSCRAATTRAACAAAAGPGGLVEYGVTAPALPPAHLAEYAVTTQDGSAMEPSDDAVFVDLTVEETMELAAHLKAAGGSCLWWAPFAGMQDGVCVADIAGQNAIRERELDAQVAKCMADNAYKPGTETLIGCMSGAPPPPLPCYCYCYTVQLNAMGVGHALSSVQFAPQFVHPP